PTEPATSAQANNLAHWMALVGRLLIAAIFVLAGANKLTDPAGTIGYIASVGLPTPQLAYGGAVAVELIGGILLIAGFKTRWVALALALFSVATAVLFHNDLADQNQFIQFFKNLALAGGLLQVSAFGPGRLSFDGK
ncbi:MAG: DoxX family protein, partial [Erythrobacter sp.]